MRGIALTLFVLATLPMAFVQPMVGLLLWIWFNYMNPHRLTFGFAYDFPWVFLTASITLFSMLLHPRDRQPVAWKPVSIFLLLFVLWTGITTVTAVESIATQQWIIFLKIQMMVLATLMLVTNKQRLHWVLWVMVLSFGFWALKGGVFTLLTGGHYHVFGPSHSFFTDNNDYALVMCTILPLMRYLQLHESRKWIRRGLWVLMIFTVVAILGTYSRAGFLALWVDVLMLVLKSRRRVALLLVLALALPVAITFMPSAWVHRMHSLETIHKTATQNESAVGRIQSWIFATNVAIAHPVTGGGFHVWASGRMWDRYGPPGAVHRAIHSIFFEVLGEQGFVGLALYLGLIFAGWRTLARVRRLARAGPERIWMGDLAGMIQVSLLGFIAAGCFAPVPYIDIFYQLLAIALILQVFAERTAAQSVSQPDVGVSSADLRKGRFVVGEAASGLRVEQRRLR